MAGLDLQRAWGPVWAARYTKAVINTSVPSVGLLTPKALMRLMTTRALVLKSMRGFCKVVQSPWVR